MTVQIKLLFVLIEGRRDTHNLEGVLVTMQYRDISRRYIAGPVGTTCVRSSTAINPYAPQTISNNCHCLLIHHSA
jgi:hypothetical protein